MRAPPDRRRHHVCSPLAVGVDGARLSDAQGINGLHDRRGDSAGGDRYSTCLLFAIPHHRFRIDTGDALADCGVDNRVDLAGAVTWFYDRRGSSAGFNSGSDFALASLPLAPAFGLTNYVRQLALPLPTRIIGRSTVPSFFVERFLGFVARFLARQQRACGSRKWNENRQSL